MIRGEIHLWVAPSYLLETPDGVSKTIEFGGMVHLEWGCKVTFTHKHGQLSKEAEYGFKGNMDGEDGRRYCR